MFFLNFATSAIIVFVCLGCFKHDSNLSIRGNWRTKDLTDKGKVYQEIYIDDNTITSFASDIREVSYSFFYKRKGDLLYFINDNEIDTIGMMKYKITNGELKLILSDSVSTEYVRISNSSDILLKDYLIKDEITIIKYLKDFDKRFDSLNKSRYY